MMCEAEYEAFWKAMEDLRYAQLATKAAYENAFTAQMTYLAAMGGIAACGYALPTVVGFGVCLTVANIALVGAASGLLNAMHELDGAKRAERKAAEAMIAAQTALTKCWTPPWPEPVPSPEPPRSEHSCEEVRYECLLAAAKAYDEESHFEWDEVKGDGWWAVRARIDKAEKAYDARARKCEDEYVKCRKQRGDLM